MHIIHVTHRVWPVVGGSEHYVFELARRQVLDGHSVMILATEADALEALWAARGRMVAGDAPTEREGVSLVRLPLRHLPLGEVTFPALRRLMWLLSHISPQLALPLTRYVPWVPALSECLAVLPADLYFAWNLTLEGLTAAVAREAGRRRVPWLALPLLHLARPAFYTMPHQLRLLRGATRILPQTETERRYLLDCGFDPEHMSVLSPGVENAPPAGVDGQRFRARHGITAPLVATFGALGYDKGTLHLLEAARRLWNAGVPLELALVGIADRAVIEAVACLPDAWSCWCHLLGRVPDDEKWDALAASDIVALPSRTESFGIVFLEAWLLKKPVIGARAGALVDVVSDGEDGLLVSFGDVAGLAEGIRTLLAEPERAMCLGARGYLKVQEQFTWERQYARLREIVAQGMTESKL